MKKQFNHEGAFMRNLRESKKLSQAEIAKSLILHNQAISNLERGKSGLSLKHWLILKDIHAFIWEDLAKTMAQDQFDFVAKFDPFYTPEKDPNETMTPTDFMNKVNQLYSSYNQVPRT